MSNETEIVVSITQKGQATIPKVLRERHGIDAPGKVRFRETDDGQIVVETVARIEEMRGHASAGFEGTNVLRAGRALDRDADQQDA